MEKNKMELAEEESANRIAQAARQYTEGVRDAEELLNFVADEMIKLTKLRIRFEKE